MTLGPCAVRELLVVDEGEGVEDQCAPGEGGSYYEGKRVSPEQECHKYMSCCVSGPDTFL